MVLFLMVFMALFASILATDKPLWISTGEAQYFPALSGMQVIPLKANENTQIDFREKGWEQIPGINFIKPKF